MKVLNYIFRKLVFIVVLYLVLSLIDYLFGTDLIGLVMWLGATIIYLFTLLLGLVVSVFVWLGSLF